MSNYIKGKKIKNYMTNFLSFNDFIHNNIRYIISYHNSINIHINESVSTTVKLKEHR